MQVGKILQWNDNELQRKERIKCRQKMQVGKIPQMERQQISKKFIQLSNQIEIQTKRRED